MFERFSGDARKLMGFARHEAVQTHTGYIDAPHIALALLSDSTFGTVRILDHLRIDVPALKAAVQAAIPEGNQRDPVMGQIPFSPQAKAYIEAAAAAAERLNQDDIATAHFLVADLESSKGILMSAFVSLGIDPVALRVKVIEIVTSGK